MSSFFCIHISQGSVATCLKRGRIFIHEFVANLLPSRLVKKFENRIIFSEVMAKSLVSCFFWLTVYKYAGAKMAFHACRIRQHQMMHDSFSYASDEDLEYHPQADIDTSTTLHFDELTVRILPRRVRIDAVRSQRKMSKFSSIPSQLGSSI